MIRDGLEGARLINAIRRSWTSTESLSSTMTLLFKPLSFAKTHSRIFGRQIQKDRNSITRGSDIP